jgi:hypothetical protein
VVLLFGNRRAPRSMRTLPSRRVQTPTDVDAAVGPYRRLVVLGTDSDLATVLTRLLRAARLDVEVGYAPRRRTPAARVYRIPAGWRAARRAQRGSWQRMPLIRDDTGTVIVGAAHWQPPEGAQRLRGEAVVDDAVLFDGEVTAVRIEPTATLPGLRARVSGGPSRRWLAGRAAQLGTTGVIVVRDGVPVPRAARRSTFYRHTEGWLLVR